MDADGNYVPSLGLDKLHKYAALFGLDHKSGVEIDELEPQISDIDPERSAIDVYKRQQQPEAFRGQDAVCHPLP